MATKKKRTSHEDRLRDWLAAHDQRNVLVSHDAKLWSLILVGPRIGGRLDGRRDHIGVRCETLSGAIAGALEAWGD